VDLALDTAGSTGPPEGSLVCRTDEGGAMSKGSTGAAAGGGAIYGLGIFGALFYYWQQADAFWEYVWAIFPKAIFWPAFMIYEGFAALGA
jgi:hypothetical protein